jgi:hypothetical protein
VGTTTPSLLPISIKPLKATKHEGVKVGLLVKLAAPVPGRGKAPVNAAAAIVAAAVEAVLEEV